MPETYIVDAVRTPVGRRKGGFADVHPADLGGHVIAALVERTGIDPAAIDDVIYGCLDQIGSQAGDIARTAALAAGLPETVPGVTIDRQCGSSQQAVHFAAQGVMSGTVDLVVAGGVQKMTQFPILSGFTAGEPFGAVDPWSGSQGWHDRYGDLSPSQFVSAEMIANRWNLTREQMEQFALRSHQRAIAAQDNGWFDKEIVAFAGVSADEGPRRDTTLEKMAALKPLSEGGRVTAAVSNQISDASSAVLGADPEIMLTAPIPATERALKKTGLAIGDIDIVEINEAFAPVVLAWLADIGADPDVVNPSGGAISLGHPLGATGTRLMTTMLNNLERTAGRYGLQTMCEGGGQANVTIIERLG